MKKPTILYIDDDESSLFLLKIQLKNYDINVLTEWNGILGLQTYLKMKDQIDIVLVDLKLPYMSGYDVISEIKKINKNVPIIIMTANNFIDEKDLSKDNGADDFYIKPIKKENIINLINDHIKQCVL